jgi:hypothetical protein
MTLANATPPAWLPSKKADCITTPAISAEGGTATSNAAFPKAKTARSNYGQMPANKPGITNPCKPNPIFRKGEYHMTTPTNPTPDRITPAELRALFQSINERLDQLEADITTRFENLAAAAIQPAPAQPTGQTVQFDASILLVGIDDNGAPTYKAKGGQYMKFGVRIWPETLPIIGIDPATLKPGPNPINMRLVALMGERGPRKVISKI